VHESFHMKLANFSQKSNKFLFANYLFAELFRIKVALYP
jgi:hypothetical protein